MFQKLIPYIFVCLTLLFVNMCTFQGKSLKFSEVTPDSTDTQSKSSRNSITVVQKGNGNSVSISQSGSATKTNATVKSTGLMNKVEINSGSNTLQTSAVFKGSSNLLVTQSESGIHRLSVKASPMISTGKNFRFNEFYFILNWPKKQISIYQTPGGVIINK